MAIAIFDVGKTNVKLSLVEAGAIRRDPVGAESRPARPALSPLR